MEFSEVREWKSLFAREDALRACAKNRRGNREGLQYPSSHRRDAKYIIDELDSMRCTINELMDVSPEPTRPQATLPLFAAPSNKDSQVLQDVLRQAKASQTSADKKLDGDSSAYTQQLAPGADLGPMVSEGASKAEGPGRQQPLQHEQAVPQDVSSKVAAKSAVAATGDKADKDSSEPEMFFRRRPSQYIRPENLESKLTAKLRLSSSTDAPALESFGYFPGFAAAEKGKDVEVRVHLPPYTGDSCMAVMLVPATMRVEALEAEVIRQHPKLVGSLNRTYTELRFWDDDEEEPDDDCAPFDKGLEVGCLNVTDVALCFAQPHGDATPISPPLSSPEPAASKGARVPEAFGGSITPRETDAVSRSPQKNASFGSMSSGSGSIMSLRARRYARYAALAEEMKLDMEIQVGTDPARSSSWKRGELSGRHADILEERSSSRPPSSAENASERMPSSQTDTDPTVAKGQVSAGNHVKCADEDEVIEVWQENSDSEAASSGKPSAAMLVAASAAPSTLLIARQRSKSTPQLSPQLKKTGSSPRVVVGGFDKLPETPKEECAAPDCCQKKNPPVVNPIRKTFSTNNVMSMGGRGFVGGFEPLMEEESRPIRRNFSLNNVASMGSQRTGNDKEEAVGSRMRELILTVPEVLARRTAPGESGTSSFHSGGGDSEVILQIRESAKLRDVLDQLRQEHGRAYDPFNFAVERVDDGIRQRLDWDMQVRQLSSHTEVLHVVRMDQVALLNADRLASAGRLPDRDPRDSFGLNRPPREIFCFNERDASVGREYNVFIAVVGPKQQTYECHLFVDRQSLYHQPPRGVRPQQHSNPAKQSGIQRLVQWIVPGATEGSRAEPCIFVQRRVSEVRSISFDKSDQMSFSVVYGSSGPESGAELKLMYQAESPTQCAELVAFIEYLMKL